jgi:uncharacterized protein YggU (UPF0235/DUF167 family)
MPAERPWRIAADGLTLLVRLTPKGGRDALDTIERLADGRLVLKARVRTAAHEGAANAALRMLIARAVGAAVGRVEIVSGATARIKTLKIIGDNAELAAALEQQLRVPDAVQHEVVHR